MDQNKNGMIHPWDLTPSEAVELQRTLREQIVIRPVGKAVRLIAGADISYNRFSDVTFAGIIILNYHTMEKVAYSVVQDKMQFPYIPGLLSFREIPSLHLAWQQLPLRPDVIALDGHGIAHPRRMGIATHFGLLTGQPSIGIAKKKLTGNFEEPGLLKGDYTPVKDGRERLGFALRTKNNVKPVFVSPGHLADFEDCLSIALHCSRGYRIPEPTRQAHLLVNQARREEIEPGVFKY